MGPQGPQEILDLGLRLKRWIEEVAEVRSIGHFVWVECVGY